MCATCSCTPHATTCCSLRECLICGGTGRRTRPLRPCLASGHGRPNHSGFRSRAPCIFSSTYYLLLLTWSKILPYGMGNESSPFVNPRYEGIEVVRDTASRIKFTELECVLFSKLLSNADSLSIGRTGFRAAHLCAGHGSLYRHLPNQQRSFICTGSAIHWVHRSLEKPTSGQIMPPRPTHLSSIHSRCGFSGEGFVVGSVLPVPLKY